MSDTRKSVRETILTLILFSSYYIEQTTASTASAVAPDVPYFKIDPLQSDNGFGKVKVTWEPNTAGTPGSHFYVKYRIKHKPLFESTPPQINEDNIEIGGLEANQEYEFRVVAVDGNFETPSAIQVFDTSGGGKFQVQTSNNVIN